MKTLFIALILWPGVVFGWGAIPLAISSGEGSPSVTYTLGPVLFEETGSPTALTGWVVNNSTGLNFDSTSSPIEGTESLRTQASANIQSPTFSGGNMNSGYFAFRFRVDTMPTSNTNFFAVRQRTGATGCFWLRRMGATTIGFDTNSGGSFTNTFSVNIGQNYYFKGFFDPSDGSNNGVARGWISSNGTSWTLIGEKTTGTETTLPNELYFDQSSSLGADMTFDDIRVSDSDFNY